MVETVSVEERMMDVPLQKTDQPKTAKDAIASALADPAGFITIAIAQALIGEAGKFVLIGAWNRLRKEARDKNKPAGTIEFTIPVTFRIKTRRRPPGNVSNPPPLQA